HMPGHKGKPLLGPEALDITEIRGADALYEASGIIRESERNASALFGTEDTFYSTEGSSQVIQAMLYLAGLYARKKAGTDSGITSEISAKKTSGITSEITAEKTAGADPGRMTGKADSEKRIRILASRNVHKAFLYACALLDYDIIWLPGDIRESYLSIRTSKEQLEEKLEELAEEECLPDAVFVTSPNYLGNLADIRGFSEVLEAFDIPLLVDDAHGAYLHFLEEPAHPMDLGADLCCDSAHKTLTALTGCAYLHIGRKPEGSGKSDRAAFFAANAKNALALFGSTSPSYLLLESLDLTNKVLSEKYREDLAAFIRKTERLKQTLTEKGFRLIGEEPLKITLDAGAYGYRGNELADILRAEHIECEHADRDVIVFMLTPGNTDDELEKLKKALMNICRREEIRPEKELFRLPPCRQEMSVRDAVMRPHRVVEADLSEGLIAGAPLVSCPPAVPIVISGERITKAHIAMFRYYGIDQVEVMEE
ncbi:MAG: aminotransferase class I/II-fold pyridoxal phosphate-dependent enzyme, partial [Lachnospiraceae bacterium]|nr:aminotransferase class I/II-fold pyridoxal phosphate-dependent enzyme [Lachnospiraceae bacterium]